MKNPPKIGEYWPAQGGHYAGIIRNGETQWHLILGDCQAIKKSAWSEGRSKMPGEFSQRDGAHNTALILSAEPKNKIAAEIAAINIDGHSDYYFPAAAENQLIITNLPDKIKPAWHWSSTQYDAGTAWSQDFSDGLQRIYNKDTELAALAVRRILIIE